MKLFIALSLITSILAQCNPSVPSFEDGKTPTRILHVATNGSPNGDGTQGNPLTLAAAVSRSSPGTSIAIHAGNYNGGIYLSNIAGTEANPIWIGGVSGESNPVFGTRSNAEAIHFTRISYVIIHKINITAATINGMNVDDGGDYTNELATHHLIFRNLNIYNIGTGENNDCLKLSGVNYHIVRDSFFSGCDAGDGVDHVGCHHGLIVNNIFINNGGGVQSKGGSDDIEIQWNRFINTDSRSLNMGGSTGYEFFRPPLSLVGQNYEARNIRAYANVFEGESDAPIALAGCLNCTVAHNTLLNTKLRIFRVLQENNGNGTFSFAPCSQGRVFNNLMYFSSAIVTNGGRMINVGANTDPASFVWRNNLWYAFDNPSFAVRPSYTGGTTIGEIYNQNPLISNIYRIGGNGAAAGAGVAQSEIGADFERRCFNNPPSIGAYEANPISFATTGSAQGSSGSQAPITTGVSGSQAPITTGVSGSQAPITSGISIASGSQITSGLECNCPLNSICSNGQCVCDDGFYLLDGSCQAEQTSFAIAMKASIGIVGLLFI